MEECFAFAVNEHSHKRMVGTRQILSESGEKQDNGKVFVKIKHKFYDKQRLIIKTETSCALFRKSIRKQYYSYDFTVFLINSYCVQHAE